MVVQVKLHFFSLGVLWRGWGPPFVSLPIWIPGSHRPKSAQGFHLSLQIQCVAAGVKHSKLRLLEAVYAGQYQARNAWWSS